MAFHTKAALDALIVMLEAIPGVQRVYRGVPESLANTVSVYVALAGQPLIPDKATQLLHRDAQFLVVFGYRVQGAEATAENVIADAIDAFVSQFYADRSSGAGLFAAATTDVISGDLDLTLAASPEYQISAGQEYRRYPLLVSAGQLATYG
jgi:hypothetical protein